MDDLDRRSFLKFSAGALLGSQFAYADGSAVDHPDFKPDPRIEEIFRDLAAPLHERSMRDRSRGVALGKEGDLSGGYTLSKSGDFPEAQLATAYADFAKFMSVCMEVEERAGGYA